MPNVDHVVEKCERCGHDKVWDNRNSKRNPKAPDFKCANKECGEGYWLVKGATAPPPKAKASGEITIGMLADKMNEAYEALQLTFGVEILQQPGSLDTFYKMAFTELKGKIGG